MKKIIIILGVILAVFVTIYFVSRYVGMRPFNGNGQLITEQQAIEIAAGYSGTNIANVQVWANFETSTWKISFGPKQPTDGHSVTMGGQSHYVIDAKTGAILSQTLSP